MVEISNGQLNKFQNGTRSYLRFIDRDGLRDEGDVPGACRIRFLQLLIEYRCLRQQFLDRDRLCGEHAIQCIQAKAALAVKEIGNMRRLQPRLARQQRTAQDSTPETA